MLFSSHQQLALKILQKKKENFHSAQHRTEPRSVRRNEADSSTIAWPITLIFAA